MNDIPEGWNIQYNPKPIPTRADDWDYWHDDIDIDRPELCGTAPSREAAIQAIRDRDYD